MVLAQAACKRGPLPLTAALLSLYSIMQIRQQDAQTVEYVGSAQLMTPYKVASQTTELKAGGGKVHSYTEPAKLAGGRIT